MVYPGEALFEKSFGFHRGGRTRTRRPKAQFDSGKSNAEKVNLLTEEILAWLRTVNGVKDLHVTLVKSANFKRTHIELSFPDKYQGMITVQKGKVFRQITFSHPRLHSFGDILSKQDFNFDDLVLA